MCFLSTYLTLCLHFMQITNTFRSQAHARLHTCEHALHILPEHSVGMCVYIYIYVYIHRHTHTHTCLQWTHTAVPMMMAPITAPCAGIHALKPTHTYTLSQQD